MALLVFRRKEKKSTEIFFIVKCYHIFVHSGRLGIPSTSFQRYRPGYFIADAIQNPCVLSILCCVLKPEAVEERFRIYNLDIFFIWVNELSLRTKVFVIIELSSKKWWKQKLGAKYSISKLLCSVGLIKVHRHTMVLPVTLTDLDGLQIRLTLYIFLYRSAFKLCMNVLLSRQTH